MTFPIDITDKDPDTFKFSPAELNLEPIVATDGVRFPLITDIGDEQPLVPIVDAPLSLWIGSESDLDVIVSNGDHGTYRHEIQSLAFQDGITDLYSNITFNYVDPREDYSWDDGEGNYYYNTKTMSDVIPDWEPWSTEWNANIDITKSLRLPEGLTSFGQFSFMHTHFDKTDNTDYYFNNPTDFRIYIPSTITNFKIFGFDWSDYSDLVGFRMNDGTPTETTDETINCSHLSNVLWFGSVANSPGIDSTYPIWRGDIEQYHSWPSSNATKEEIDTYFAETPHDTVHIYLRNHTTVPTITFYGDIYFPIVFHVNEEIAEAFTQQYAGTLQLTPNRYGVNNALVLDYDPISIVAEAGETTVTTSTPLATTNFASVALSGSYNDLSNKPTIPTIQTASEISDSDNGFTTASQVYNHVLNALSGITGAMTFKGVFSASGPSGFPSRNTAKAGDLYVASISNANGYITVDSQRIENGDSVVFTSDGSENVNANFTVIQGNLSNVLICPNNTPSNGKFVEFSGTGTQTRPSNYTVSSLTEKIIDETIDTLTYGKLKGIPFETGCKTEFYLGTFTQTVDFDPTTGNWINPEDPTNILTPDEVWGYNSQTGEYSQGDLTWSAIKYTYPSEALHGDINWQNYGIEYYPCTWAGPYGYEFYLDMSASANRNLWGLLSDPSDILNYSVRLTYNGIQYVLPIEEHYTRGDEDEPSLNGYYVGQRDVENVNPPVKTQSEDRALWTHPFKVFFELNGNPVSGYISAVKVSLRVSENGILGGVEVVKTEDVGVPSQIPVQCVPTAESIKEGEKRFVTGDQVYKYVPSIPDAPTTDGSYTLSVTVSSGTPTYTWVSSNS